LLYAWALSLVNGIWFMLVFGGCDLITSHRSLRIPSHFAAELKIPFIPAMTAAYMPIYLLFLAGPFILRTRNDFRAVIATLATMIGVAGVGFLLVPAQLAFSTPREQDLGIWAGMFHLADRLHLTFDLVPSLHVALSVGHTVAILRSTGPQSRKGEQEGDLPHVPTHLWNAPERERRKCQGCSGTSSSREFKSDDRRLYAGGQLTKTRGSEQARKHGYERSRSCEIARNLLSGPNWTMKENGDFVEVIYFVGVPDGI
jgi:hypothetical protein